MPESILPKTYKEVKSPKRGPQQDLAYRQTLYNYYKKNPNISFSSLGRVFKISRERVRVLINEEKAKEANWNAMGDFFTLPEKEVNK